jgi:hypothetical protein
MSINEHTHTHTYQLEKDEALALASESVGEVDRYRSRLVDAQVSDLPPICPPTHLAVSLCCVPDNGFSHCSLACSNMPTCVLLRLL